MKTLKPETAELIRIEMESIPEKYQKNFNSMHEGLGVLREEYIELEQEIFFGEKKAEHEISFYDFHDTKKIFKDRVRKEAIQVAAMAVRIIQELT
jgi:hypothetical protein